MMVSDPVAGCCDFFARHLYLMFDLLKWPYTFYIHDGFEELTLLNMMETPV